jgi:hypothetical protein
MIGGSWGWAPGPVALAAVYAPALVSFVGGIEVGGVLDPVSWVALSWGEPWYPSFGASMSYYNRVNLCGSIFAAGVLAAVWGGAPVNLAFGHDPAAVNVASRSGFVSGHPVGREFVRRGALSGNAFDHAAAMRGGVRAIGPTREGRFGGHPPLRVGFRGVPPPGAVGRSAVTRQCPGARGGNLRSVNDGVVEGTPQTVPKSAGGTGPGDIVHAGQTIDDVKILLGPPDKTENVNGAVIYVYTGLKVTFDNGRVTNVQ